MRLKTFTAATVSEAMAKIREALGGDAIIVNIDSPSDGPVRVTAAFEQAPSAPEPLVEVEARPTPMPQAPFDPEMLSATLRYHGLPSALGTRLLTAASAMAADTLAEGLAAALETMFRFQPIVPQAGKPILFVGPPGAGKTLTIAKLAAEAAMAGEPVRLISMDLVRAGGVEQLQHFARLMKLEVETASSPEALRVALGRDSRPTLIDSTGANPYGLDDIQALARTLKVSGAEPVLVLPAGTDALEAAEMADIFASLGAKRMIATRFDGARRYGGIMTALYKGSLALAALGTGPYVADGITPPTALELARYIIVRPDPKRLAQLKKKAAS